MKLGIYLVEDSEIMSTLLRELLDLPFLLHPQLMVPVRLQLQP